MLVWALCLHPATPGWAARCGCVCLGSDFGCALRLLAGVLRCVCARVRAPRLPKSQNLGHSRKTKEQQSRDGDKVERRLPQNT